MLNRWIQKAIKHKGSFKAWCKKQGLLSKDGKVTRKCIEAGKRSKNPTIRRRAILAETLMKMKKGG